MKLDCIFFEPIRVRYAEVDKQGIVYNGHYATYTEVCFSAYMRSKGMPYNKMVEETGFEIINVKSTFEYFGSVYEEDLIEVGLKVVRVGEKSFTLGFEIYRSGEDKLLVYSEYVFAGYDSAKHKSRPLSDLMRSLLEA